MLQFHFYILVSNSFWVIFYIFWEVGLKVIVLYMDIQFFLHPIYCKESAFNIEWPWQLCKKKKRPFMCASIFELCILFHWSICLSLCQHHSNVFTAAFRWTVTLFSNTGNASLPNMFFFKIVWLLKLLYPYVNFRTTLLISVTTNNKRSAFWFYYAVCLDEFGKNDTLQIDFLSPLTLGMTQS